MRLAEVLARTEGLTKRFVHYLEAQGHFQPKLIQKERIARREYSESDLRRIQAIWAYSRRGFSVQSAVDLVNRGDQSRAYVFFHLPPRRWRETLELLRGFDQVTEAAVVYGEEEDIIITLRAPDDGDIYSVLGAALRAAAISGQPTIYKTSQPAISRPAMYSAIDSTAAIERELNGHGEGERVLAYVLVKASAKQIEQVIGLMRGIDGIVEASVIYGESDVICRVEVEHQRDLDRIVMHDLHEIDAVESTRTFIVVGDLHWQRDVLIESEP